MSSEDLLSVKQANPDSCADNEVDNRQTFLSGPSDILTYDAETGMISVNSESITSDMAGTSVNFELNIYMKVKVYITSSIGSLYCSLYEIWDGIKVQ